MGRDRSVDWGDIARALSVPELVTTAHARAAVIELLGPDLLLDAVRAVVRGERGSLLAEGCLRHLQAEDAMDEIARIALFADCTRSIAMSALARLPSKAARKTSTQVLSGHVASPVAEALRIVRQLLVAGAVSPQAARSAARQARSEAARIRRAAADLDRLSNETKPRRRKLRRRARANG